MTKETKKCGLCENKVEMGGMDHCRDCLTKFFDLVKDTQNWKLPIQATMEPGNWSRVSGVVSEAIEYFTATTASFSFIETMYGYRILIEADGYYNGPAA